MGTKVGQAGPPVGWLWLWACPGGAASQGATCLWLGGGPQALLVRAPGGAPWRWLWPRGAGLSVSLLSLGLGLPCSQRGCPSVPRLHDAPLLGYPTQVHEACRPRPLTHPRESRAGGASEAGRWPGGCSVNEGGSPSCPWTRGTLPLQPVSKGRSSLQEGTGPAAAWVLESPVLRGKARYRAPPVV